MRAGNTRKVVPYVKGKPGEHWVRCRNTAWHEPGRVQESAAEHGNAAQKRRKAEQERGNAALSKHNRKVWKV